MFRSGISLPCQENMYPAGKPMRKVYFEKRNTFVQLPTAIQEREFKPLMEMGSVRPLAIVVT